MLEARITKGLRDFSLDCSLRAEPGKILVLMGENGAGKSTVLNIIAGILPADAGSIRLGDDVLFDSGAGTDIPPESRRIGYVFQNPAAFPHLSVRDNIAFGLRARRRDAASILREVGYWLKEMNIGDLADVKAGNLSGGQKQRVALARALATGPALLMLDEPFAALDAENIDLLKGLMRSYVAGRSIPCIVVTHRIGDSRDIGDRVCVLCQGKKEWEGSPDQVPAPLCHCRDGPDVPYR